jgi:hypothetical protein
MARFGKIFSFFACACLLLTMTAARRRAADADSTEAVKPAASAPAASSGSGTVVFDMNSSAGWDSYADNTVVVKMGSAAAKTGKALEIDYNMNSGGWFGVNKQVPIDMSKYAGVRFSYRGEGSKNTLEVKFEDSDGSNFGYLVKAKTNPEGWTAVEVPFKDLKYWWGGDQILDLKKLKLHFAASKKDDDEGGSGKIIVGSVQAYGSGSMASLKGEAAAPAAPAAPAKPASAGIGADGVVDSMAAAPAGWDNYKDGSVTLNLAAGQGQRGKALVLDYNMNTGGWLGVWKQVNGNLSGYKGVRFAVRGEGAANSVEFKFEDKDGSNFGKVLAVKSNTGSWTTIEVPFSDLTYFWGGDQKLDLADPKIHFAISKKEGDAGGAGKLLIDKIELYK